MRVSDAIMDGAVGAVQRALEAWDARIIRTRHTLESLYATIADRVTTRRLEGLAWMLSLVRALSSVLPCLVGLPQP
jgi:hypothetical protein